MSHKWGIDLHFIPNILYGSIFMDLAKGQCIQFFNILCSTGPFSGRSAGKGKNCGHNKLLSH